MVTVVIYRNHIQTIQLFTGIKYTCHIQRTKYKYTNMAWHGGRLMQATMIN